MVLSSRQFPFVVVGALIIAVFLVAQGVCALRTGVFVPFFLRSTPTVPATHALRKRVASFIFNIVLATAIFSVLAESTLVGHVARKARGWIGMRIGPLIVIFVTASFGILLLANPSIAVKWAREAHPQLEPKNMVALAIARTIGVLLVVFAALILTSVLRSS